MSSIYNNEHLNREVELHLSILEDINGEYSKIVNEFKHIAEQINNSRSPEVIKYLLKEYYKYGLLSPLKLTDDEFNPTVIDNAGNYINNRYEDIVLDPDDDVVYLNAYMAKYVRLFNTSTNEEIENIFPFNCTCHVPKCPKIYITKGGVITGERVECCMLKKTTVRSASFIPREPIIIPVNAIFINDNTIYTVDAREPKLKELMNAYDVHIIKLKDYPKIDIRKFKKLKSRGS